MASTRDLWVILRARDEASRVVRSFSKNVRTTADQVASAAMGVSQAATIMAVGFGAAGAVGLAFLKNSIDVAVEYERQVRHTATQVDKFGGNLEELAEIGRRAARDIAVPFEQIQSALFDIFSSMEVNVKEAEQLLRSFSKAAVAGQTDIQSASRATIGIMNAFNVPIKDVNKVLDIQFQLIQEGIGTYEEWNARIGKVSPSAIRAGQSIETMAAALAAATRFGIPAAQSATSIARVFDAFSNPKAVAALKKLGVSAVDAKGNFRPFIDVMKEFRTALDKLGGGQAKRAEAIIEVFRGAGGTIEARKFLNTLLSGPRGIELFQEILAEFTGDIGSFERAYGIMADSVAGQSQLLSNRWMVLREALGKALIPTFMKIVDFLSGMVEKFNNLDPSTKAFIGRVAAIASVGAIVLGVFFGLIAVVGAVAAAFAIAGTAIVVTIGGFVALLGILAGGIVVFKKLWDESARFRQLLMNIKDAAIELWNTALKPFFVQVGAHWREYMQPALNEMWRMFNDRILPVVNDLITRFRVHFLPVLQEVGKFVGERLAGLFRLFGDLIKNWLIPAIAQATKFYFEHKEQIDKIVKAAAIWVGWILKIGAVLLAIFAGTLAIVVVASIVVFINTVIAVINIITRWVNWLRELWNWFKQLPGAIKGLIFGIASLGTSIIGFIVDTKNKIFAFFSSAGSWLYNAGRNLIMGLIDGMKSMLSSVTNTVSNIAQRVKDVWPFSPAKRGPLSGRGNPLYAGQNIVKLISKGMLSEMDLITRTSSMIAGAAMQPNMTLVGVPATNSAPSVQNGNSGNTQNFYITTQEIDPQYHAAQLGWLVENRM